jgi:cystathionine gamma-synthase
MTARPRIAVIAKEPPGGRCRLYFAFAEALAVAIGAETVTIQGPDAPAFTVDGEPILPADGVILSADELHAGLVRAGLTLPADLLATLEAVEEKFMAELAP